MAQDDIPAVRGAPGGLGGHQGALGDAGWGPAHPGAKKSDKIMTSNHGLEYPNLVLTQKFTRVFKHSACWWRGLQATLLP